MRSFRRRHRQAGSRQPPLERKLDARSRFYLVGIVGVRHAGSAPGPATALLVDYPAVEAALGLCAPALFMSFLLASFQRHQSLCVTAALAGALGGILLVFHSGGDPRRNCLRGV